MRVVCAVVVVVAAVVAGSIRPTEGSGDVFHVPVMYTDGVFYASLGLGTPPQFLDVQIDTGSSDLVVYAAGCSGCAGKPSAWYDMGSSSSAAYVPCKLPACTSCETVPGSTAKYCAFADAYGDGTEFRGIVTAEKAWWNADDAGEVSVRIEMGQILVDVNDTDPSAVQGILGMAYASLSAWAGTPVFAAMVADGIVDDDVFSLCLPFTGRGSLVLGSDARLPPTADVLYTPIVTDSYYVVNVTAVAVGDAALTPVDAGVVSIVDSGTTLVYLVSRPSHDGPYDVFASALRATCGTAHELAGVCNASSSILDGFCVPMTSAQIDAFPLLRLAMPGFAPGATVAIPPAAYLMANNGVVCLGISPTDAADGNILGDVFMTSYNVVFDRASTRIGFAPATTCPTVSMPIR